MLQAVVWMLERLNDVDALRRQEYATHDMVANAFYGTRDSDMRK